MTRTVKRWTPVALVVAAFFALPMAPAVAGNGGYEGKPGNQSSGGNGGYEGHPGNQSNG